MPANPPIEQYWSVTAYDRQTHALIKNMQRASRSSQIPEMQKNADGSIDVYFGPHAPPGKETNWVPTDPARKFELMFRLYAPKKAFFDKTWVLPDVEKVAETQEQENDHQGPATGVSCLRPARPHWHRTSPRDGRQFRRAPKSDLYMGSAVKDGAFGKFVHRREPTAIDKQTVIRMNRDTLYSAAVFDLDAGPVTVTLPDAGKRFMSMQVINEDHYTPTVVYAPGPHTTDEGQRRHALRARRRPHAGRSRPTRRMWLRRTRCRTRIKVEQTGGPGKFEVPNWDQASQKKIRDALLVLAHRRCGLQARVRHEGAGRSRPAPDRRGIGMGRQSAERTRPTSA